jgi:hypothetical protein
MAITPTTMKTSEILEMLKGSALNDALQDEGLSISDRNAALATTRQALLGELDRRLPIPPPSP